jgi:hypothetical protein
MTIVLAFWTALASGGLGGQDVASGIAPLARGAIDAAADPRDPRAITDTVRDALRAGKYPWYDAQSGKLRPLVTRKSGWAKIIEGQIAKLRGRIVAMFESIGRFLSRLTPGRRSGLATSGDALMTALLWTAFAGLLVALLRFWYRRQPRNFGWRAEQAPAGQGALLAELAGADPGSNVDPWSEAVRRRAAGDLAGALVYLFVHQLVSLEQKGVIRLVPGTTGRQHVLGLEDTELRRGLTATLRLFEEVQYGHRQPGAAAFEAAWARGLAFRRDVLGTRDEN